MPFSSGTFSMVYNFTTEAASPPIEIAKLTAQFTDIADGMSIAMLRDGTGLPTANQNYNGFTLTNIGAATTLTGVARVSELIDQDHIYYIDSGSANTYAITPSPAIAAYEEGQRFVVRIANGNSGASTLNVNGLGAIAIQHPDGSALQSGALAAGGVFEFTYDANTNPDRWVLTSPAAEIADGMLSSNIPLINASTNTFTGTQLNVNNSTNGAGFNVVSGAVQTALFNSTSPYGAVGTISAHDFNIFSNGTIRATFTSAGAITFAVGVTITTGGLTVSAGGVNVTGDVTTPNTSAAEVGFKGMPRREITDTGNTAATDNGKAIVATTGTSKTFTFDGDPPTDSVVAFINRSGQTWTLAASGTLTTVNGTSSVTLTNGGSILFFHLGSGNWQQLTYHVGTLT